MTFVRRASLWLPPLVYMTITYGLSAQSDPLPQVTAHVWDKLLHTTEYAGLGFLFARALFGEGVVSFRAILGAIVLASAYGASDEYHQFFVPRRSSDIHDWMADTIGASIGALVYLILRTLFSRGTDDPVRSRPDTPPEPGLR